MISMKTEGGPLNHLEADLTGKITLISTPILHTNRSASILAFFLTQNRHPLDALKCRQLET